MEEVLAAITRRDEAESLVCQPLDCAVHRRHCRLVENYPSLVAGSSGSPGNARSGIGFPRNSRRHAWPIHRAHRAERCTRALSVAMPVFAYICRYSLEINTNAIRARMDSTTRERAHTSRQL